MAQVTIEKLNSKTKKEILVPGDKSISHRSIMMGSIASGTTEVSNFLMGEDCLCTKKAFQALGVAIEEKDNKIFIHGKGIENLKAASQDIYLGNSGTAMRLLCGLYAGLSFDTTLTGDESLSGRPMNRVIKPLEAMGALIASQEGGRAPLKIKGVKSLNAIHHQSKIASAQVKSCILLAGLNADGITSVSEPHKSRDHSERMLKAFGADLTVNDLTASINPENSRNLIAQKVQVPSDISSAAFYLVAGAILEEANFVLPRVGVNPTRTGILDVLKNMGVKISYDNEIELSGEPIADIHIESSDLKATEISGDLIPRLIDEIPVISLLAAQAEGTTVIKDAEELKVKESNRIASTISLLKTLGVQVEETPDGMIIEGQGKRDFDLTSTSFDSHGDHRLAMSAAIAALKSNKALDILKTEFVDTSFPGFFDILKGL